MHATVDRFTTHHNQTDCETGLRLSDEMVYFSFFEGREYI